MTKRMRSSDDEDDDDDIKEDAKDDDDVVLMSSPLLHFAAQEIYSFWLGQKKIIDSIFSLYFMSNHNFPLVLLSLAFHSGIIFYGIFFISKAFPYFT